MDWLTTDEYYPGLYFIETNEKQQEEYRRTYVVLGYNPYKKEKEEQTDA